MMMTNPQLMWLVALLVGSFTSRGCGAYGDFQETKYVFNGVNYYFVKSPLKTWAQAKQICLSRNGGLAVILSQAEAKFIFTKLDEVYLDNPYGQMWAGGLKVGGQWRWSDNDEAADVADYAWMKGEPFNLDGYECYLIRKIGPKGGQVARCGETGGYICKGGRAGNGGGSLLRGSLPWGFYEGIIPILLSNIFNKLHQN